MKNKFLIVTFFSTYLLFSPNVKAANIIDNQTVDNNKVWTVKFDDEIEFDDLTKQCITVTDSKGSKVKVGVQLGKDTKTIVVTAPQNRYIPGENYVLNIGGKVHSNNGKSLKNECKLHFNIRSADDTVVTFKDDHLESEVRSKLNKWSGNIYKSDVEKITGISLMNVYDISGIEKLTNLKYISSVYLNKIADISALKGLTSLQEIELTNSELADISALKGLTNLQKLNLEHNKITDISILKGLTNLQEVVLIANPIRNISVLKGLTNLKYLHLKDVSIKDTNVLKGLTNLQYLNLSNTSITDINALKGLTKLQYLDLGDNSISDLSILKGLTNLQELHLDTFKFGPNRVKINDISVLKELTNLRVLRLDKNSISDDDKKELENALPNCLIIYCS